MFKFLQSIGNLNTYSIYELLNEEKIEYVFRGNINEQISDGILSLAEVSLEEQKDFSKISKRIYFILIEGLQNITRHQEHLENIEDYNDGFIVIQRKEDGYVITTGNACKKEDVGNLRNILDKINNLSEDELNEYYRNILTNNTFSSKGGAGLGMIEIARKSGNKIAYDFQKISSSHSYFYMQTYISPNKKDISEGFRSLENLKEIHKYFIKNNILFNMTGILTHNKLVYLVGLLESYFNRQSVFRNKFFSILIELLQNVGKYAESIELSGVIGKHSILFVTSEKTHLGLIVGNFIRNHNVENFLNYIDKINSFTIEDLYKLRTETLSKFKKDTDFSINGLGLIDIRLRSKKLLDIEYKKISDYYNFVALKVKIDHIQKTSIEALDILPSTSTPNVTFDQEKGLFSISGNSFPEDSNFFYEPIITWLKKNFDSFNKNSVFEFNFLYLNSSTRKEIIKIFNLLEQINSKTQIQIKYFYVKDYEDTFEFGIELKNIFKTVNIEMIQIDKEEEEKETTE